MPSPRSLSLLLPAAATALALAACGSGPSTEEPRSVGAFDRVEAEDGVDVVLRSGREPGLRVRAGEHVIDDVHTEVRNGTLRIWHDDVGWFAGDIVIDVRAPAITALDVSGGSDADLYGVDGDALAIHASGGSDVTARGRVDRLTLDASGGSDADLQDLAAREASVEASGGSDAEVTASGRLDVEASGGSDVSYRGEPELTRDVSGSSDLTRG
jgi:hypothetical protein